MDQKERFLEWARAQRNPLTESLTSQDMDAVGSLIGEARLVALGEGLHGVAEPLEFRNRIFQWLVENKGFTAIALESGIIESRVVHRYVCEGQGELGSVLADGLGWTFDRLPQNASLIRWLRDYNEKVTPGRKLNFYGFDVPGSPGEPRAARGVDTGLRATLEYLAAVDGESGRAFQSRLASLLPYLRFGPWCDPDRHGYQELGAAERDELTTAIAELIALLQRGEKLCIAASTPEEYAWAVRAAIGARQVDEWLRRIPIGWKPSGSAPRLGSDQDRWLVDAGEIRDCAMAANLEWIFQQEGPRGKVLVFAHNYHISGAPLHASWAGATALRPLGTYLRARGGHDLLIVGHLLNRGQYVGEEAIEVLGDPEPASIEGLASQVGTSSFLLDLRQAPATLREWLQQEHSLRAGSATLVLPLSRAFDVLFYADSVTPAYGGDGSHV